MSLVIIVVLRMIARVTVIIVRTQCAQGLVLHSLAVHPGREPLLLEPTRYLESHDEQNHKLLFLKNREQLPKVIVHGHTRQSLNPKVNKGICWGYIELLEKWKLLDHDRVP